MIYSIFIPDFVEKCFAMHYLSSEVSGLQVLG